MTDPLHLAVQVVLPGAAALLVLVGLSLRLRDLAIGNGTEPPAPAAWRRYAWWVFLLLRVALPVGLFVILTIPRQEFGSDAWYWVRATDRQLAGEVPGVDFPNGYGPLLPYAQTAGRWLLPGRHWLGVLLPFVIGDALALHFGERLARALGGRRAGVWVGAWLLLTPLTWQLLVVHGQDEMLFLGTLVFGVWLLHRGCPARAGLALGLGLALTKPNYAIYAGAALLPLLLGAPGGRRGSGRRDGVRAWAAFAGTVVGVYGAYLAGGAEGVLPGDLPNALDNYPNGVSLSDLARRRLIALPVEVAAGAYVLAAGAAAVTAAHRTRGRAVGERAVLTVAAVHAVTMLVMPMCVAPYVTQGLAFALLAVVAARGPSRPRLVCAVLLGLLGVLVPLLWVRPVAILEITTGASLAAHGALLALLWRSTGSHP